MSYLSLNAVRTTGFAFMPIQRFKSCSNSVQNLEFERDKGMVKEIGNNEKIIAVINLTFLKIISISAIFFIKSVFQLTFHTALR
jgi:hypothetical protein